MSVGPFTLPTNVTLIPVVLSTNWKTFTLPAISANPGRMVIFKDMLGNSGSVSTLRLSTTGTDTIEYSNVSTANLSAAFGAWTFMNDGITRWYLTNQYSGLFSYVLSNTKILIYHLDAGNTNSYPGTGTTWTDLVVSQRTLTLYGTPAPAYNSSNGGYISFAPTYGRYGQYGGYTTSNFLPYMSTFSIEAWIYYSGGVNSSDSAIFTNACPTGSNVNLALYTSNDSLRVGFYTNGVGWVASGPALLISNAWQHVVGTYDMMNFRIYFNNSNTVTTANTTQPGSNGSGIYIMRNKDPTQYSYLGGKLGLLRIYNYALSAAEVTTNYNGSLARFITSNGLVYYLDAGNSNSHPGSGGTTWTDLMGTGKNVTLVANPTYYASNGGYVTFNGTSQYGTNTTSNLSYMSNFTIEAWIYYTNATAGQSPAIYTDIYPGCNSNINAALRTNIPPNMVISFFKPPTTWYNSPDYSVPTSSWYHLVGTYDMANLRLYANTSTVGTTACAEQPGCNLNTGFVIMKQDNGDAFIGGNLAMLRIYNRAITATEIAFNYVSYFRRFSLSGLVYYLDAALPASYPGSGTTWTDLMGTGKNITLYGNTTPAYSSSDGGYLTFDAASSQYGSYTTDSLPNMSNNCTIEAWYYYQGAGGVNSGSNATIYTNIYPGTGNATGLTVGFLNTTNSNMCAGAYVNGVYNTGAGFFIFSNTWNHLVATYNQASLILYNNGYQVGSNALTSNFGENTSGFNIMKSWTNANYMSGRLALLRIYNRALSSNDVLCNYLTSMPSRFQYPYVSTGLLYHFDAGRTDSYPGTGPTWTDIQSLKVLEFKGTGSLPYYSNINGGCIVFNSNWAQTTTTVLQNSSNFSIEAWIYYTGVAGRAENPYSYNSAIFTTTTSAGNNPWAFGAITSYPPSTCIGFWNSNSWKLSANNALVLPRNTWCHVVGTYNKTTFKIYSNASIRSGIAQTSTPTSVTSTFQVMKRWDAADYLNGYLAVLRVYNRALTDPEIAFNYNATRARFGR